MATKYLLLNIGALLLLLFSCATDKITRQYGDYKVDAGKHIILKEDQTFTYYSRQHLSQTNAFGHYTVKSDTLILTYTDKNYDSLTGTFDNRQITLAQALGLQRQFLWKGKKLYLIVGDNKSLRYAKLTD